MDYCNLLIGDATTVLASLEPDSFDACVTDPPYELNFMGKAWDRSGVSFRPEIWEAVYRVLKPGAHLLAFGGTRTFHRMTVAIEDAGFEIRDCLSWLYGSGFPKSLDVSKAIDKAAGEQRERIRGVRSGVVGDTYAGDAWSREFKDSVLDSNPITDLAREWNGWGTALKPAHEIIIKAQKPYDIRHFCGIMAPTIKELLCQLRSHAKDADDLLTSSRSECGAVSDSVLWDAVAQSSTPDDLFALTDTLPSEWEMIFNSNIVWSWLNILGAIWRHASRFTIEMASSLTTDLRTLNSLLSVITPKSIAQIETRVNGVASSALIVDSIFNGAHAKLLLTLGASVAVPATSTDDETGLRPDLQLICMARKPFRGTVAANVTEHGTGAINVDGCRIAHNEPIKTMQAQANYSKFYGQGGRHEGTTELKANGRWPANVVIDEDAAAAIDAQSGVRKVNAPGPNGASGKFGRNAAYGSANGSKGVIPLYTDTGGASRFFYCAKASTSERAIGLPPGRRNDHPTVKPIALMDWLVRLVMPPGGHVIDPFVGSGTTGIAVLKHDGTFTGIDIDPKSIELARRRIFGGMRR